MVMIDSSGTTSRDLEALIDADSASETVSDESFVDVVLCVMTVSVERYNSV